MPNIQSSMLIDADAESVFDFVVNHSNRALWQRDVQRQSEPMPELVLGSSWTEVRTLGLYQLRITITITDLVRPSRLEFAGVSGRYHGHGTLEFHAEGTRTRVTYVSDLSGRGLAVLFAPLIASRARRVAQGNLFRLRMCLAPIAQDAARAGHDTSH